MGFGTIATAAILLSAGLLAGSGMFQGKVEAEAERDRAADQSAARLLRAQRTDLDVTNFQYIPGLDRVRVTALNVGHTTLHADQLHLLLDGTWVDINLHTINSQTSDIWTPGSTLIFEATWSTSPQYMVIVTEDGVQHFWRA